jgi:alkanesulfonate monooxygenase SsuD/methylene tetrahydromethanopterin reductase-like flavin-dependent oxidoreductase (luciferase family)
MQVYHFSEMPYPQVWDDQPSLRVSIPNSVYDPKLGADMYERFFDEWVLCDEIGLNIMVNEHHATATCLSPACSLPLAILARITKKARLLALGVPIANRPNPVRIAEEMAMIDVISRGRLDMGLVRGSPYEIAPTNAKPVGQMERFWEAHDLILKALSTRDGPFSWESENYHYRKVNVWPRPYQDPHPPVWVTATSPSSAPRIAEHRHVIATLISGVIAKDLFKAYRDHAAAAGWQPGLDRFAYCAVVGVGETEAEGLRRADQIADYIRTSPIVAREFASPPGYKKIPAEIASIRAGPGIVNRPLKTPEGKLINQKTASVEEFVEACSVFAGTPDQVCEQITRFYNLVGGFGHLLMMGQGGHLSHEDTVGNLTLFSREVLPRLQELTGGSITAGAA